MTSPRSRGGKPWILFYGGVTVWLLCGSLLLLPTAEGAGLILNEFSAVASDRYLDGGSYKRSDKEDTFFQSYPGLPDGRIEGNGGNWVEMLVIQDHLDISGWQLRWAETGSSDTDGTNPWYGDPTVEQGIITFSSTAAVWSDLRAGTILTISEKKEIPVDTDWDTEGEDRNFTDGLDPGDAEVDVVVDFSTDVTSYDPLAGNFNLHVSSRQEQADGTFLVSTVTNVAGNAPGDFSVGPADWQMSIYDDEGALQFGPVGEDVSDWGANTGAGGVNDEEVGKLQKPEPDDLWTVQDWMDNITNGAWFSDGTTSTFRSANMWTDSHVTKVQDLSALRAQVPEPSAAVMLLGGVLWLLLVRRRKAAP